MKDFSKDAEIVENTEMFIDDGSDIKMSLVICCWATAHLLKRSIETYVNQDLPTSMYELIVIDDAAPDDVKDAIEFANGKINMRYIRLQHDMGMRGNTKSFNVGFALSRGNLLCESTPETMFPREMMRRLYAPHLAHSRSFVAAKTYNLTPELQMQIDSVDWREDISNIMLLPGFFNPWTLNNFQNTHFGTHQTCSIRKEVFYEIFPNGFPLYADYGSEDPRYCGLRQLRGVRDVTIMQPMAIHQWHPQWSFWATMGKAPNCNKHGHTIRNIMGDMSIDEHGNRTIPDNGTSGIWDGGSTEWYSPEQVADQRTWDERVKATGCKLIP